MECSQSFHIAINALLVETDYYVLYEDGVFTFHRVSKLFDEKIKASDLLKNQITDVVNHHFENCMVEFNKTSSCFWISKS